MDASFLDPGALKKFQQWAPIGPYDVGELDINERRKYLIAVEKEYPENRQVFNSIVGGNLERHGYLPGINSEDDNLEETVGKKAIFVLRLNEAEFEKMKDDPKLEAITEAKIVKPHTLIPGIDVGFP